jgi:hypothetical protein
MWIGIFEEIKCGDYCEHHCVNFIVFGEWSHKGESLGACDEFPWGVLYKASTLGAWVMLSQKSVKSHVAKSCEWWTLQVLFWNMFDSLPMC